MKKPGTSRQVQAERTGIMAQQVQPSSVQVPSPQKVVKKVGTGWKVMTVVLALTTLGAGSWGILQHKQSIANAESAMSWKAGYDKLNAEVKSLQKKSKDAQSSGGALIEGNESNVPSGWVKNTANNKSYSVYMPGEATSKGAMGMDNITMLMYSDPKSSYTYTVIQMQGAADGVELNNDSINQTVASVGTGATVKDSKKVSINGKDAYMLTLDTNGQESKEMIMKAGKDFYIIGTNSQNAETDITSMANTLTVTTDQEEKHTAD